MRPGASNTPAERSPASRTDVLNAVRTRVCACSSTTAISRLHMICVCSWDNAALGRATMMKPYVRWTKAPLCQVLYQRPGPGSRECGKTRRRLVSEMGAQDTSPSRLTDEQVHEVVRRRTDFAEGREPYATDEEMAALWKKC